MRERETLHAQRVMHGRAVVGQFGQLFCPLKHQGPSFLQAVNPRGAFQSRPCSYISQMSSTESPEEACLYDRLVNTLSGFQEVLRSPLRSNMSHEPSPKKPVEPNLLSLSDRLVNDIGSWLEEPDVCSMELASKHLYSILSRPSSPGPGKRRLDVEKYFCPDRPISPEAFRSLLSLRAILTVQRIQLPPAGLSS